MSNGIGIPMKHEHIDPLPSPLPWQQGTVGRILYNERRHLTSPLCFVCSTADSQQRQVRHVFNETPLSACI